MTNYRRYFSKGSIYFLTAALQDRSKDWLIRYIDEFREAYKEAQEYYPFETIAICILPEHFHLIMQLPENDDKFSNRIQAIKRNFTKRLPLEYRTPNISQSNKREAGIWQRRFWEHCIQHEQDLNKHIDYVYYNPVKHNLVKSVSDWKYSSFHRDVKKGLIEASWGSEVTSNMINLYNR